MHLELAFLLFCAALKQQRSCDFLVFLEMNCAVCLNVGLVNIYWCILYNTAGHGQNLAVGQIKNKHLLAFFFLVEYKHRLMNFIFICINILP
jgi:hypothetical protein